LRNISYLYIRYAFDADVFPNGVPEVTVTIKGKKVYDPRTDTTAWSDNPALCIRDYLTSGYGLAEAAANIDDTSVSTAANICDQTSTLAGTTRYTCNGNFTTSQTPYDILGDLLTSMGGLLWYAQGEWRMKPAYWVAPTVAFTEDDLRSSVAVKTRHSRRDNFNTVRGTFRGDESDWQVTDYPEVTNAAFVAADNGQESVVDIDLPFTDNSIEARRLARITLERNRQQLTVSASFGLRAFQVQVGDVIELSVSRFGWNQKEFEVVAWTFGLTDALDLQVQMTLREISESVFDEVDDGIVYERDNVTVLSPFEVPLPSLNTASAGSVVNTDGTTVPSITFSWSVTDASLVDYYDFQWKPSSASDWQSVVIKSETQFILAPAVSGVSYDYRVRAVSYLGVKSAYASSVTPVSTGDDGTTPNAPSNLVAEAGAESIKISWDAPTQNTDGSSILDLFQYRIYRNTTNNFGTSSLVGRISGDVFTDGSLTGGTTYYYWVTALDFTGNESVESAVASAEAALVETARSNGVFYIGVTTLPTTSSGADTDFTAAIGDPVDRDQAWFYTGTLANPTAQSVWIYDEATDTWTQQQEVIDGSLVVSGTITADRLEAQSLSALGLTIGTLSSSPSGERIVITDEKIEVYDSSNVLRVVLGNLA
jgi:hypothetical protein